MRYLTKAGTVPVSGNRSMLRVSFQVQLVDDPILGMILPPRAGDLELNMGNDVIFRGTVFLPNCPFLLTLSRLLRNKLVLPTCLQDYPGVPSRFIFIRRREQVRICRAPFSVSGHEISGEECHGEGHSAHRKS